MLIPDWVRPSLGEDILALFRAGYGVLLLAHLLLCLPHARRFFLSERWGGYGQSSPFVAALHNPTAMPLVLALWFLCGLLLVRGDLSPWPALINLLLCRYYFLHMRWRGVLRGMGAPGFMTHWLAQAVFLLELTHHAAPRLFPLSLLVLQTDFALIMFVAGLYKLKAGFFTNEGMEYGLVNPEWGRWWKLYRRIPPGHFFFKFNNQLAWAGEMAAGALMLHPVTRFWGALFIFLSFIYIHANIRLAVLPFMVMLACVLFAAPDSPGAAWLAWVALLAPASKSAIPALGTVGEALLNASLLIYLATIPLVYYGLSYNLYRRKPFTAPLQRLLDGYANFFGFILWRVFSADITHFFVNIYSQNESGQRELLSRWGQPCAGLRYTHVAEAIAVTSVFTTLKYYPNNPSLFRERLLRYTRTVSHPSGSVLVFECVSIEKGTREFRFVPITEFVADLAAGTVAEHPLDEMRSLSSPVAGSPVHEAARPGSYLPARR